MVDDIGEGGERSSCPRARGWAVPLEVSTGPYCGTDSPAFARRRASTSIFFIYVLLRERPRPNQWIGVVCTIAGVSVLTAIA
jgi:hypothetical protein